jgi:hypothetical protein
MVVLVLTVAARAIVSSNLTTGIDIFPEDRIIIKRFTAARLFNTAHFQKSMRGGRRICIQLNASPTSEEMEEKEVTLGHR